MNLHIESSSGRARMALWFQAARKLSGYGKIRRGDAIEVLEECSVAGLKLEGRKFTVAERSANWLLLGSEITRDV